jgi:glutamyl-tRNA synthetase
MASTLSSPGSNYRGRLAPSPTGYLHVGHARTFWTAFERAREAGGTLVMRMEDLDAERSRANFAEAAMEDLRWLGIRWQEGPDKGGPCAPYVQSKRRALYLAAWRKLLEGGWLFECRCSRKDIESALAAPHERLETGTRGSDLDILDDEPIYPGTCRPGTCGPGARRQPTGHAPHQPGRTPMDIEKPDGAHWRFHVPDGEKIEFVDRNLGPQRFVAGKDFGDFVVWRREGGPSYQLACVVDDAAMRITEVVRGADLLKSTARQILLNRALGFEIPAWYHCRLVVAPCASADLRP